MAIRTAPVLHPHFLSLASRPPYSPAPVTHRQEGSYDHHPLCASRPNHDKILQVLGGQFVGFLLRRNTGPAVVFGFRQELHGWERTRHCIEQFPQRGAFLRWLVYGFVCFTLTHPLKNPV